MPSSPRFNRADATPLIRKLESIGQLDQNERNAILELRGVSVREFATDQDIVRDGDRPSQCCLLLSGLACRYKILGEGKRQILSFHVAGDVPDLQSIHLDRMDHNFSTLSPSRLMFIPHQSVRELCSNYPRLANMLWRETLVDAGIFREWITNMGRRTAYGRISHLLSEVFLKSWGVGLTKTNSFEFPVTQTELGDATGLSTVHVNRTFKALRSEGVVSMGGGVVTIHKWKTLQEIAEFDPTYLHLNKHYNG